MSFSGPPKAEVCSGDRSQELCEGLILTVGSQ